MVWLLLSCVVILALATVLRGAPYVPTHGHQVELALDTLELKAGERLVDIGSGDGRVLLTAARRGLKATGYEINPLLCVLSWLRSRRYRSQITIVWGDVWSKKLPSDTRGVFIFTMGRFMPKVEHKIKAQGLRNIKLASYGFEIPGRKPLKRAGAVILYEI